jgi:hypothetical protein
MIQFTSYFRQDERGSGCGNHIHNHISITIHGKHQALPRTQQNICMVRGNAWCVTVDSNGKMLINTCQIH